MKGGLTTEWFAGLTTPLSMESIKPLLFLYGARFSHLLFSGSPQQPYSWFRYSAPEQEAVSGIEKRFEDREVGFVARARWKGKWESTGEAIICFRGLLIMEIQNSRILFPRHSSYSPCSLLSPDSVDRSLRFVAGGIQANEKNLSKSYLVFADRIKVA